MRKRKTHEDASKGKKIKKQDKRLSQIIENFLEEPLTLEDLMKDPDKIEHLRNLINENLFENKIDIFDWDWEFESKYPDPVDVPEAYDATQDYKDRIHFQALGIIDIHKSINENFWDKFKEKILEKSYSPRSISNTDCKKKLKNDNDANSKYDYESFSSLEDLGYSPLNGRDTIEMSTKVTYRIEQDVVYITNHINNAIMKFIELWNERPTNIIKKCQSKSCARIFIQNTKHTRKYCKKSCGSKNLQREKREKDRERYNKYHRNWYNENISKA